MSGKRITLIICVIFYTIMIIFTVSARKMHNTTLPRVRVGSLEYEAFPNEGVDGEKTRDEDDLKVENYKKLETNNNFMMSKFNLGIPKEMYDNHKVYILSKEIVNGEERSIAREVTNLVIGGSNDTSYEVLSGLSGLDQVIISGQESILDGCEVNVDN